MHGRLADISGDTLQSDGWNLVLTDAGACASPSGLSPSAGLIPAPVPGTVAEALEKAGLFAREHPHPLNDRDAWYLCRLVDVNAGDIEEAFERDRHGRCAAILKIPGVTPWWPRTHGIPHLYEVTLIIDDVEHRSDAPAFAGWRSIAAPMAGILACWSTANASSAVARSGPRPISCGCPRPRRL